MKEVIDLKSDLTKGRSFKTLFLFALPMILSVTLQQFYNICDSMLAGKMVGSIALAGISATYPLTMIYLAIGTGFGVGENIVVARFIGEKNYSKARKTIYTSIISICLVGIVVTIFGLIFLKDLVLAINAEESYFKEAVVYLRYYTFGIVFLFVYNAITSAYQAIGNSKIPLYFLIFSTILNIFLDIFFVKSFNLGVEGLALATFLSQMLACILSLICLVIYIEKNLKDELNKKIINFAYLKDVLVIGLPSILQAATVSFGQLLIQSLINGMGDTVVAGYGAAYKLTYVVINIFTCISNALSTFVSQNAGAKKYKRINEGFISGFILCAVLTIITVTLFALCKEQMLSIFENENEGKDVTRVGALFISTISPFIFLMGIKIPCDGVLKGSKDMFSFVLGTLLDLIIRVVFSYILVGKYGLKGIFISWPIGWAVGAIISFGSYLLGRWKKLIGYKKESLPYQV